MSALCILSNLSVIPVPRAKRGLCSKQLDYWLKFFSPLMIYLDVENLHIVQQHLKTLNANISHAGNA